MTKNDKKILLNGKSLAMLTAQYLIYKILTESFKTIVQSPKLKNEKFRLKF